MAFNFDAALNPAITGASVQGPIDALQNALSLFKQPADSPNLLEEPEETLTPQPGKPAPAQVSTPDQEDDDGFVNEIPAEPVSIEDITALPAAETKATKGIFSNSPFSESIFSPKPKTAPETNRQVPIDSTYEIVKDPISGTRKKMNAKAASGYYGIQKELNAAGLGDRLTVHAGGDKGLKIAEYAKSQIGTHGGSEKAQCANWTRGVFSACNIPVGASKNPIDKSLTGDAQGPGFANSFFGEDVGTLIRGQEDLLPGDLVGFHMKSSGYPDGVVTHVGIYTGGGMVVHRPGANRKIEQASIGQLGGMLTGVRPHEYGKAGSKYETNTIFIKNPDKKVANIAAKHGFMPEEGRPGVFVYGGAKLTPDKPTPSPDYANVPTTSKGWSPLKELAVHTARGLGVAPNVFMNLVGAESNWATKAVSQVGAFGLTQLMPATAQEEAAAMGLSVTNEQIRNNPELQLKIGASYLNRMLGKFGNYPQAVAAYNAGPGRIENVINGTQSLPTETKHYVAKVLGLDPEEVPGLVKNFKQQKLISDNWEGDPYEPMDEAITHPPELPDVTPEDTKAHYPFKSAFAEFAEQQAENEMKGREPKPGGRTLSTIKDRKAALSDLEYRKFKESGIPDSNLRAFQDGERGLLGYLFKNFTGHDFDFGTYAASAVGSTTGPSDTALATAGMGVQALISPIEFAYNSIIDNDEETLGSMLFLDTGAVSQFTGSRPLTRLSEYLLEAFGASPKTTEDIKAGSLAASRSAKTALTFPTFGLPHYLPTLLGVTEMQGSIYSPEERKLHEAYRQDFLRQGGFIPDEVFNDPDKMTPSNFYNGLVFGVISEAPGLYGVHKALTGLGSMLLADGGALAVAAANGSQGAKAMQWMIEGLSGMGSGGKEVTKQMVATGSEAGLPRVYYEAVKAGAYTALKAEVPLGIFGGAQVFNEVLSHDIATGRTPGEALANATTAGAWAGAIGTVLGISMRAAVPLVGKATQVSTQAVSDSFQTSEVARKLGRAFIEAKENTAFGKKISDVYNKMAAPIRDMYESIGTKYIESMKDTLATHATRAHYDRYAKIYLSNAERMRQKALDIEFVEKRANDQLNSAKAEYDTHQAALDKFAQGSGPAIKSMIPDSPPEVGVYTVHDYTTLMGHKAKNEQSLKGLQQQMAKLMEAHSQGVDVKPQIKVFGDEIKELTKLGGEITKLERDMVKDLNAQASLTGAFRRQNPDGSFTNPNFSQFSRVVENRKKAFDEAPAHEVLKELPALKRQQGMYMRAAGDFEEGATYFSKIASGELTPDTPFFRVKDWRENMGTEDQALAEVLDPIMRPWTPEGRAEINQSPVAQSHIFERDRAIYDPMLVMNHSRYNEIITALHDYMETTMYTNDTLPASRLEMVSENIDKVWKRLPADVKDVYGETYKRVKASLGEEIISREHSKQALANFAREKNEAEIAQKLKVRATQKLPEEELAQTMALPDPTMGAQELVPGLKLDAWPGREEGALAKSLEVKTGEEQALAASLKNEMHDAELDALVKSLLVEDSAGGSSNVPVAISPARQILDDGNDMIAFQEFLEGPTQQHPGEIPIPAWTSLNQDEKRLVALGRERLSSGVKPGEQLLLDVEMPGTTQNSTMLGIADSLYAELHRWDLFDSIWAKEDSYPTVKQPLASAIKASVKKGIDTYAKTSGGKKERFISAVADIIATLSTTKSTPYHWVQASAKEIISGNRAFHNLGYLFGEYAQSNTMKAFNTMKAAKELPKVLADRRYHQARGHERFLQDVTDAIVNNDAEFLKAVIAVSPEIKDSLSPMLQMNALLDEFGLVRTSSKALADDLYKLDYFGNYGEAVSEGLVSMEQGDRILRSAGVLGERNKVEMSAKSIERLANEAKESIGKIGWKRFLGMSAEKQKAWLAQQAKARSEQIVGNNSPNTYTVATGTTDEQLNKVVAGLLVADRISSPGELIQKRMFSIGRADTQFKFVSRLFSMNDAQGRPLAMVKGIDDTGYTDYKSLGSSGNIVGRNYAVRGKDVNADDILIHPEVFKHLQKFYSNKMSKTEQQLTDFIGGVNTLALGGSHFPFLFNIGGNMWRRFGYNSVDLADAIGIKNQFSGEGEYPRLLARAVGDGLELQTIERHAAMVADDVMSNPEINSFLKGQLDDPDIRASMERTYQDWLSEAIEAEKLRAQQKGAGSVASIGPRKLVDFDTWAMNRLLFNHLRDMQVALYGFETRRIKNAVGHKMLKQGYSPAEIDAFAGREAAALVNGFSGTVEEGTVSSSARKATKLFMFTPQFWLSRMKAIQGMVTESAFSHLPEASRGRLVKEYRHHFARSFLAAGVSAFLAQKIMTGTTPDENPPDKLFHIWMGGDSYYSIPWFGWVNSVSKMTGTQALGRDIIRGFRHHILGEKDLAASAPNLRETGSNVVNQASTTFGRLTSPMLQAPYNVASAAQDLETPVGTKIGQAAANISGSFQAVSGIDAITGQVKPSALHLLNLLGVNTPMASREREHRKAYMQRVRGVETASDNKAISYLRMWKSYKDQGDHNMAQKYLLAAWKVKDPLHQYKDGGQPASKELMALLEGDGLLKSGHWGPDGRYRSADIQEFQDLMRLVQDRKGYEIELAPKHLKPLMERDVKRREDKKAKADKDYKKRRRSTSSLF